MYAFFDRTESGEYLPLSLSVSPAKPVDGTFDMGTLVLSQPPCPEDLGLVQPLDFNFMGDVYDIEKVTHGLEHGSQRLVVCKSGFAAAWGTGSVEEEDRVRPDSRVSRGIQYIKCQRGKWIPSDTAVSLSDSRDFSSSYKCIFVHNKLHAIFRWTLY